MHTSAPCFHGLILQPILIASTSMTLDTVSVKCGTVTSGSDVRMRDDIVLQSYTANHMRVAFDVFNTAKFYYFISTPLTRQTLNFVFYFALRFYMILITLQAYYMQTLKPAQNFSILSVFTICVINFLRRISTTIVCNR